MTIATGEQVSGGTDGQITLSCILVEPLGSGLFSLDLREHEGA